MPRLTDTFILEHCPGCGQSRCHGGDTQEIGPCQCGWGERHAQLALTTPTDREELTDGNR